ncbi:MAG TPA: pirin family protein [Polyangiales bacterium]|nr:pirin family protein [Polyangiales bacterium]
MSTTTPDTDSTPACLEGQSPVVSLLVESRPRDLGGGFVVRRTLPSPKRRLVGPFIFFDQMGPVELAPGQGLDVRPHPHIALATVTYLFAGEIEHRDSLGSYQTIRPGDVNWMIAGRGIAHSERSGEEARRNGMRLHGIQSWVALPKEHEEAEPQFEHHPRSTLPHIVRPGVTLDVIAGTAYGERSPTPVLSPTFYVHAQLEDGATLVIDREHEERAVYVVEGELEIDGARYEPGMLAIFNPGFDVTLRAHGATRAMLLGGAKIDGERHIFWNFVSSSEERIEQAKSDWREHKFPLVPGDEEEFIPLP